MAAKIIYIKRGETTYVAEDRPYRDKEKGPRHERVYIGKLGPDGQIIYNKAYKQREKVSRLEGQLKEVQDAGSGEPVVPQEQENGMVMVGEKRLLDLATEDCGLNSCLRKAFGASDATKLMALSYYGTCKGGPLSKSLGWMQTHGMKGALMSSSDVSALLGRVTQDKAEVFFREWLGLHLGKDDNILFDITSISSYGTGNEFIPWGYNRDKEDLPQVNIALLSSLSGRLPLWFKMMDGSVGDAALIDELLDTLTAMGVGRMVFMGDRGFYSEHNVNLLTDKGHGFLMPVPSSVGWQKEMIEKHREGILDPGHVIMNDDTGQFILWAQDEHTFCGRKVRCHIYYDSARKEAMMKRLFARINLCIKQLHDGTDVLPANKGIAEKYITQIKDKDGKITHVPNLDKIREIINGQSCWWILIDTEFMDSETALYTYRERDDVEDFFDDDKNTMDLYRLRNHDLGRSPGKVFTQFLTLIVLQEFRDMVDKVPADVRGYLEWDDILDACSSFHETKYEGVASPVQGTPTKKQRDLFDLYGIEYTYKGTTHNKDNKADTPMETHIEKAMAGMARKAKTVKDGSGE